MKTARFWPMVPALLACCLVPGQVRALTLVLEEVDTGPGLEVEVRVLASGYGSESLVGMSLEVGYDAAALELVGADSSFFTTFSSQWAALQPPPAPMPPDSVLVDGVVHDRPLLWNRTRISGARVEGGQPAVLCTLRFRAATTASGRYPLTLEQIRLNDLMAGYPGDGEDLPALYGLDAAEPDLERAYLALAPVLAGGEITVAVVDSDGDGMDDAWEMHYFGDLTTAGAATDFDGDGYTDLQEYQNWLGGILDPHGQTFDPTVANAAGGPGYRPPGGILMMVPAFIHGRP